MRVIIVLNLLHVGAFDKAVQQKHGVGHTYVTFKIVEKLLQ